MSLKKNFEYIRDWVNAKFLKKVDVDLNKYYTKTESDNNITKAIKDIDYFMLIEDHVVDEEIITHALNDLHNRINKLTDSRLYGGGAILDLSGENNPNYTKSDDNFLLNDNVFDAIINKKVRIIIMEDRPNDSRENLEYVDPPIMFYYYGDRTVSTDVPINCIGYRINDSSCGWLMINKSTKIMHYENHCD